jgi:hypothetical protein
MAPGFAPLAQAESPSASSSSANGIILFWKTDSRFNMTFPELVWLRLFTKNYHLDCCPATGLAKDENR